MKKHKGRLSDQVEAARKDIETWPKWMQDAAKFEGSEFSSQQSLEATSDQLVQRNDDVKPAQKAFKEA